MTVWAKDNGRAEWDSIEALRYFFFYINLLYDTFPYGRRDYFNICTFVYALNLPILRCRWVPMKFGRGQNYLSFVVDWWHLDIQIESQKTKSGDQPFFWYLMRPFTAVRRSRAISKDFSSRKPMSNVVSSVLLRSACSMSWSLTELFPVCWTRPDFSIVLTYA